MNLEKDLEKIEMELEVKQELELQEKTIEVEHVKKKALMDMTLSELITKQEEAQYDLDSNIIQLTSRQAQLIGKVLDQLNKTVVLTEAIDTIPTYCIDMIVKGKGSIAVLKGDFPPTNSTHYKTLYMGNCKEVTGKDERPVALTFYFLDGNKRKFLELNKGCEVLDKAIMSHVGLAQLNRILLTMRPTRSTLELYASFQLEFQDILQDHAMILSTISRCEQLVKEKKTRIAHEADTKLQRDALGLSDELKEFELKFDIQNPNEKQDLSSLSLDELKAKRDELRNDCAEKGIDVSSVKKSRSKNTILSEITTLLDLLD